MEDFVTTYDPGRKQVVKVPAPQAALLQQGGFPVGEDAYRAADADGWGGAIKAFAKGVASGGTAGLSDLAMPASAAPVLAAAEKAHPLINGLGKVLGAGGAMALTGGLAPELAAGVRVMHGALAGGTEEVRRAQEHNEPINAERFLQGVGLGGVFGIAAEGMGSNPKLLGEMPADGIRGALKIAAKLKTPDANGVYHRALDFGPDMLFAGAVAHKFAHAIPGMLGVLMADRIATKALNNMGAVNAILDGIVTPAAMRLAKTASYLVDPAAGIVLPQTHKDLNSEFEKKKNLVEHVAARPETFAESFSNAMQMDDHLPLKANLIAKAAQQFSALNEALPKDPRPMTLGMPKYNPTRKEKEDFLNHFHTVTNFSEAMQMPTAIKVQLAETTNPEMLSLLRSTLIGHIAQNGTDKLKPWQKRAISTILGGPVSPDVESGYLQRLQQNAPPIQQPAPQSAAGGLGTKAAQAVTLRDMPGNVQMNMGF